MSIKPDRYEFEGVNLPISTEQNALSREIRITQFDNKYAKVGHVETSTWANFCSSLKSVVGTKDGPAISSGVFRANKRSADTLEASDLIFLDVEQRPERINRATSEIIVPSGPMPPSVEDIVERLRYVGIGSAIYTTFNHSDASPRYRIGFPLDVRFHFTDGGSHGSFCEMASLLGERIGLVDCFDHSKLGAESLFYLPRHPSELVTEARVVIVPGLALSLEWLLQIVRDRLNERESIKIKEAQRAVDETIQTA